MTSSTSPTARRRLHVVIVLAIWLSTCVLLHRSVRAEAESESSFVEVSLALHKERFYSLRDFCRESNRALRASYDLDRIPDKLIELTRQDEVWLKLWAELSADAPTVRIDRDRKFLVIRVAALDSESSYRRQQQFVERMLGVSLREWPADKGLHLPDGFDPTRRTMLLIHGLESNAKALQPLAKALTDLGIQVSTFDYPNDASLQWCGDQLSDDLKSLANRHPRHKLAIVSHSMGGLLARYCLETPGKDPGCVTDVFMLGTPNHGSCLAVGHDVLELVTDVMPVPTKSARSLLDGLGEAAIDLHPKSRFLTTLNARHQSKNVRYHLAIGRRAVIEESDRDALVRDLDRVLKRRGVSELRQAELIGLLKQADELCHGLGDGVVSIRSARLPSVHSEHVFPINHVELLSDRSEDGRSCGVTAWIMRSLQGESK